MPVYIWPYNSYSAGAAELGITRIRRVRSRFRYRNNKTIINWGSQDCPYPCINSNAAVARAVNKLTAFREFARHSVNTPPWTTSKEEAQRWDKKVVCRHKLSSYEGRGIQIVERGQPLPDAPLYVQYIKKSAEYRIHVFRGVVIDAQKKVLKATADRANVNWAVRNSANGFIFQRTGIVVPGMVREQAIAAVAALGLDFGAVDVVWNDHYQQAYVLEVNTAPGIEGTTAENYRRAFNNLG